jgi:plasmid stabilization system protein ParE
VAKSRVIFHPAALSEAEAARRWYNERNPAAARGFLSELDHAVAQVSEAPSQWPRFKAGTRRYIFPRFPFSLIYRTRDDIVHVVAVAHHRRKPGYWQSHKSQSAL